MSRIIITGGGIIGLCSAYYLARDGHTVTVVDKGDMRDNCSYGNAGYVCPSHFVPLASPGNIKQALRWMTRPDSPFYIRPRMSSDLFSWAFLFIKSSTARHVAQSAIPLRDIAVFSKDLYEDLSNDAGFDFTFQKKGLLEFFKTNASQHHAAHMVSIATDLGIKARLLNSQEVLAMEPKVNLDILGAVYFDGDAHLYPNRLMHDLLTWLPLHGVQLMTDATITDFTTRGKTITGVQTTKGLFEADQFLLSSGSWSGELASKLGLRIPLVGGRGYSLTLQNSPWSLNHPIILNEPRVALTPLDDHTLRIGGTMEITALNSAPRVKRMQVILKAVKQFFPDMDIADANEKDIWYGYRPCSADGLPYIGRVRKFNNLTIATGHAMIGLSLGAGTGKLVSEIIGERPTSIDVGPFDPQRFG